MGKKIKLTPELAYILGLWRHRKIDRGIGIRGNDRLLSEFTKAVIELGLTQPNKLLTDRDTVFFYNSAYRKFLQDVEKELVEKFKYKNEYSQAYLAGLFDSYGGFIERRTGELDKAGGLYIANADDNDELVLLRLGFRCRLVRKGRTRMLIILDKEKFIEYIKDWVRVIDLEH